MKKSIKELVNTVEHLGIRTRQIIALHIVQSLDIDTVSKITNINPQKIEDRIRDIGKVLKVRLGQCLKVKEIVDYVEDNSVAHISFLAKYFIKEEGGKSEEEISENYEYYADKLSAASNNYIEERRKKRKFRIDTKITEEERKLLYKHWCWQLYVPRSMAEEDIMKYRNEMDRLVRIKENSDCLEALVLEGEDFFKDFGEILFYYIEGFTIVQISEMLNITRKEVFEKFEKARKRLAYTMGEFYELSKISYKGNETCLPEDKQLKLIVELRRCQLEGEVDEDLLNEVLNGHRGKWGF